MNTSQIDQRIRQIRTQKGYSQEWMAGKLHISQTAYNRIEGGSVERVNPEVYCAIAEILETEVSTLFSTEQGPVFNNCNQWGEIGIIHKYNEGTTTDFLKIITAQMEALQQQIALLTALLQDKEMR